MQHYKINKGKILNIDVLEGENKGRYVSIVKNYDKGKNFLYITQPKSINIFLPIEIGQKFRIKFFSGKMPCRYMSKILDMQKSPIGELILKVTGPDEVINDNSRETLRVPVINTETEIKFESYSTITRKALLKDISVTGAGLLVNSQDKILQKKNEILYLSFEFHIAKPQQDIKLEQLKSKIKWVKNIENDKMILGVEFIKFKLGQESSLMKYINFVQRVNNWERYVKKVVGDDEI